MPIYRCVKFHWKTQPIKYTIFGGTPIKYTIFDGTQLNTPFLTGPQLNTPFLTGPQLNTPFLWDPIKYTIFDGTPIKYTIFDGTPNWQWSFVKDLLNYWMDCIKFKTWKFSLVRKFDSTKTNLLSILQWFVLQRHKLLRQILSGHTLVHPNLIDCLSFQQMYACCNNHTIFMHTLMIWFFISCRGRPNSILKRSYKGFRDQSLIFQKAISVAHKQNFGRTCINWHTWSKFWSHCATIWSQLLNPGIWNPSTPQNGNPRFIRLTVQCKRHIYLLVFVFGMNELVPLPLHSMYPTVLIDQ
jgi:hypothetical protein